MKYMGSKRVMLKSTLGETLNTEASNAKRFFDLFSGTGQVASFVAQRFPIPVYAFDLQEYSVVLSGSTLERIGSFDWSLVWKVWLMEAEKRLRGVKIPKFQLNSQHDVWETRRWCEQQWGLPITMAYGGHYFSAGQSVTLDLLRQTIPHAHFKPCLAALLNAASECVAAPGHTAQPFQPTPTAIKYLLDAWKRDVASKVESSLHILSQQYALKAGFAKVKDANEAARSLKPGDLVFMDPPYSGVQYSRFYHVLESIALGSTGEISGIGRYPTIENRPKSKYSLQSQSKDALENLFATVAEKGAKGIVTFPNHKCSNGLSGEVVLDIASKYFQVQQNHFKSTFSTLGGTKSDIQPEGRTARQDANELILVLSPI